MEKTLTLVKTSDDTPDKVPSIANTSLFNKRFFFCTRGKSARDADKDSLLGRAKELSGLDSVSRAGSVEDRSRVEGLGDQGVSGLDKVLGMGWKKSKG